MTEVKDSQDLRIQKILGGEEVSVCNEATEIYFNHLKKTLELPCKVTGVEDFKWEEFYLFGPGKQKKHDELRKKQPSCQDTYVLIDIEKDVYSEWMIYEGEDLAAKVKRIPDNKEFWLGLCEIKGTDKNSNNYQLLRDYSVWFVNNL